MSVTNGERLVTKQDLADMYQGILPYLGGMPEMVANKFSKGDLYSTDEKMIGQWTDGKPLYQKTLVQQISVTGSDFKTMSIDISSLNIDVVADIRGMMRTQTGQFQTIDFRTSNSGQQIKIQTSPVPYTLDIVTNMNVDGNTSYITLKYTKTTDTAISIGSDTDYSTDEKIVGTWVDGKPLYQKTINFGALPNTTTKEVASGLSNITVIDIKVIANSTGYSMTVPYISSDSNKHVVTPWYDYSTNKIGITTTNDRSAFSAYATLQYTKTTD